MSWNVNIIIACLCLHKDSWRVQYSIHYSLGAGINVIPIWCNARMLIERARFSMKRQIKAIRGAVDACSLGVMIDRINEDHDGHDGIVNIGYGCRHNVLH